MLSLHDLDPPGFPPTLLSLKTLRCLIRSVGQAFNIPRQHPPQPSTTEQGFRFFVPIFYSREFKSEVHHHDLVRECIYLFGLFCFEVPVAALTAIAGSGTASLRNIRDER